MGSPSLSPPPLSIFLSWPVSPSQSIYLCSLLLHFSLFFSSLPVSLLFLPSYSCNLRNLPPPPPACLSLCCLLLHLFTVFFFLLFFSLPTLSLYLCFSPFLPFQSFLSSFLPIYRFLLSSSLSFHCSSLLSPVSLLSLSLYLCLSSFLPFQCSGCSSLSASFFSLLLYFKFSLLFPFYLLSLCLYLCCSLLLPLQFKSSSSFL